MKNKYVDHVPYWVPSLWYGEFEEEIQFNPFRVNQTLLAMSKCLKSICGKWYYRLQSYDIQATWFLECFTCLYYDSELCHQVQNSRDARNRFLLRKPFVFQNCRCTSTQDRIRIHQNTEQIL